jgi:hypothetical protein
MAGQITSIEAQAALDTVRRGRQTVAGEVGLPNWYWWGLALGWVALGVIGDIGNTWATSGATLAFGAVHANVAPRILDGRHRSKLLTVGKELTGPRLAVIVLAALVALAGVTVGGALALAADGARQPGTIASIFVALAILLGGPRLVAAVGRRERAA